MARVMPTYARRLSSSISLSSIERACGKIPSSMPIMNDAAELEALRVVDRHQRHERAVTREPVLVGHERHLLQERGERRLLPLGPELACHADELLQVLDAASRLDRALRLVGLDRPGPVEHRLDELVDLELLGGRHERLHRRAKAAHRLGRRRWPTRPRRGRPSPPRARCRAHLRARRAAGATCRRSPAAAGSTMRISDTASAGLSSTVRYATASLISARS